MFSFIVKKSLSLHSLALSVFASHCHSPGCGTQHPLRALKGTCVLLAAAPTALSFFRHWRRSELLLPKGEAFNGIFLRQIPHFVIYSAHTEV